MSVTSVGTPQTFGAPGLSSRTPQRNRAPSPASSSSTVAVKHGQPSSAMPANIGVSLQTSENRPAPSQFPVRRALRKICRVSPVRYRNRTAIFTISAPVYGDPEVGVRRDRGRAGHPAAQRRRRRGRGVRGSVATPRLFAPAGGAAGRREQLRPCSPRRSSRRAAAPHPGRDQPPASPGAGAASPSTDRA
jgi:hypothetical protein